LQPTASPPNSAACRGVTVRKTRDTWGPGSGHDVCASPKGKDLLAGTKKTGMGQAREIVASALSEQELEQFDKLARKVWDKALERLGQKAEKVPESFDVERFFGGALTKLSFP